MLERGNEPLIVPPTPDTHASFVCTHPIYKQSVSPARFKHVKGVVEPQTSDI